MDTQQPVSTLRYTPNLYTPPLHSLAALKQTEKKKERKRREREQNKASKETFVTGLWNPLETPEAGME